MIRVIDLPFMGRADITNDDIFYIDDISEASRKVKIGDLCADWEATTGPFRILNKPTLGSMAAANWPASDGRFYSAFNGAWVASLLTPISVGFPNRTDSTIGMVGSTFHITPTGTSFQYAVNGVAYTSEGASVEITADQTITYVYFDANGDLQASTAVWTITESIALVAIVFKDGSLFEPTEERHGWRRNLDWHRTQHLTVGTLYGNGLAGTFGDTSLSITSGRIWDEDIPLDILTTQTICSIWHRNTGLTGMRMNMNQSKPWLGDGVGPLYDNAGTLTNVGVANFFNVWVYATGGQVNPIHVVLGQASHSNIANARNEGSPQILLSTAEWKLLYKCTYRRSGTSATFEEAADYRAVQGGPAIQATAPTSHTGLSDRDAANQHPASAISGLGDLATENWPASDDKTYGVKNGAWFEVTGGGAPGGTGNAIQYRIDATTFGGFGSFNPLNGDVGILGYLTAKGLRSNLGAGRLDYDSVNSRWDMWADGSLRAILDADGFQVAQIREIATDAGVMVEDVTLKDGGIVAPAAGASRIHRTGFGSSTLGRCAIGYNDGTTALDEAFATVALWQNSAGSTAINAATGQSIGFRIANTLVGQFESSGAFIVGTDPDSGSSAILRVGGEYLGSGGATLGGPVIVVRSAATQGVFCSQVTGDSQFRLIITADGRIQVGSGSTAPDVNLYRSAANVLKTDDRFECLELVCAGAVGTTNAASPIFIGDTSTDGSWRMTRSGNNLVFQRRESGSWVTKSTISA